MLESDVLGEPIAELPDRLDVGLVSDAPIVAYGVPVTFEQLEAYALKHKLIQEGLEGDKLERAVANCLTRLCAKLAKPARFHLSWYYPWESEYEAVISLYTNEEIEELGLLSYESEEFVVKTVQSELETEAEPMWYFDAFSMSAKVNGKS